MYNVNMCTKVIVIHKLKIKNNLKNWRLHRESIWIECADKY